MMIPALMLMASGVFPQPSEQAVPPVQRAYTYLDGVYSAPAAGPRYDPPATKATDSMAVTRQVLRDKEYMNWVGAMAPPPPGGTRLTIKDFHDVGTAIQGMSAEQLKLYSGNLETLKKTVKIRLTTLKREFTMLTENYEEVAEKSRQWERLDNAAVNLAGVGFAGLSKMEILQRDKLLQLNMTIGKNMPDVKELNKAYKALRALERLGHGGLATGPAGIALKDTKDERDFATAKYLTTEIGKRSLEKLVEMHAYKKALAGLSAKMGPEAAKAAARWQAKTVSKAAGLHISLGLSIAESAWTIGQEVRAIMKIRDLDKRQKKLKELYGKFDGRMKSIVSATKELEALQKLGNKEGLLGLKEILEHLSPETVAILKEAGMVGNLAPETASPDEPPAATTDLPTFESEEFVNREEPLKGTVSYGGVQPTQMFYDLQMRRLGPSGTARGGSSKQSLGLPNGDRSVSRHAAIRRTMGPRYSKADNARQTGDTLRKMYAKDRMKRDAANYRKWAGSGSAATSSRPCPTCRGRGRIDLGKRMGSQLSSAQSQLRMYEGQLRFTQTQSAAAANARRQALAATARARSMLASIPRSTSCPTCGGSGRMRFGR